MTDPTNHIINQITTKLPELSGDKLNEILAMTDPIYQILHRITDKLPEVTGSELKAILAIYSEGRFMGVSELMTITGMARKTCNNVMQSGHVKDVIRYVEQSSQTADKLIINKIRVLLSKIENDERTL